MSGVARFSVLDDVVVGSLVVVGADFCVDLWFGVSFGECSLSYCL